MYSRRHLNRRAGAAHGMRKATGKHVPGGKYRAGDSWTQCQRCGKDVYESEAREDGYKEGLIVCPTCYDPPHPQDYIRTPADNMAPGPLATGDGDVYDTGTDNSHIVSGVESSDLVAEGHTEVTPSTSIPTATWGGPDNDPLN